MVFLVELVDSKVCMQNQTSRDVQENLGKEHQWMVGMGEEVLNPNRYESLIKLP